MQTDQLTACITASPWPTRHRVVFGGSDRVFLNPLLLALALEGRREPVTWLQRHPLIYPIFGPHP